MRLVSWNVNGLRAVLGKDFASIFDALGADVFSLQETKLQPDQYTFYPEGYEVFLNSAQKKGYSGTATLTRRRPLSVRSGIGIPEHDTEGRAVTFHDLRHTAATRMLAAGIDVATVSHILGHAEVSVTLNRYTTSDERTKREAVNAMADVFSMRAPEGDGGVIPFRTGTDN